MYVQYASFHAQSFTPYSRILPSDYADGISEPRVSSLGKELPSPRLVSTTTRSTENDPSEVATVLLMIFGQYIDHDIALAPNMNVACCNLDGTFPDTLPSTECVPIRIPANDPFFVIRDCLNVVRSLGVPQLDCSPGPRETINQLTQWLDSSNVYGSDEEEQRELREFRGGRLKSQINLNGGRELLPDNEDRPDDCDSVTECFLAGDERVNEQPNLAVMHTIFLREHNRVAQELLSLNPSYTDEILFQEARRIVNAEYQHIIYNEFLPILIGPTFLDTFGLLPLTDGFSNDYRPEIDARVTNEFGSAAFRVGHTLIPGLVQKFEEKPGTRVDEAQLRDLFNNIDILRARSGIDKLLRGWTRTPVETADDHFTEEVCTQSKRIYNTSISNHFSHM